MSLEKGELVQEPIVTDTETMNTAGVAEANVTDFETTQNSEQLEAIIKDLPPGVAKLVKASPDGVPVINIIHVKPLESLSRKAAKVGMWCMGLFAVGVGISTIATRQAESGFERQRTAFFNDANEAIDHAGDVGCTTGLKLIFDFDNNTVQPLGKKVENIGDTLENAPLLGGTTTTTASRSGEGAPEGENASANQQSEDPNSGHIKPSFQCEPTTTIPQG